MGFFSKASNSPQKEDKNSNQQLVDTVVNSSQQTDQAPDQEMPEGMDEQLEMTEETDNGQPGNQFQDNMNGELDPDQEQDLEDQSADQDAQPDQDSDQDQDQDMDIDAASDEDLPDQEMPEDGEMPEDPDQDGDQDQEMSEGVEDGQDGPMIYVSGDGDSIGAQVGQAVLHDDEQALHEISNAINEGNSMVTEWAEQNGGTAISSGGDEFILILPAELQDQLEDLRSAYQQIVGATLTLGIGNQMSEAGKALIFGKLHGKDQIAQYDPSMEEFLDSVYSQGPEAEDQKMNEQYLGSMHDDQMSDQPDQSQNPDPNQPDQDQMDPNIPVALEDGEMTKDDEQVALLPPPGEIAKDEGSLRDKMMQVVESFRQEKETIEAAQQQNPEMYSSFMQTLACMIDLARKLGPSTEAPAEQEAAPDMEQPLQETPEDGDSGEPQP